jgi:hypothetical protein
VYEQPSPPYARLGDLALPTASIGACVNAVILMPLAMLVPAFTPLIYVVAVLSLLALIAAVTLKP